MDVQSTQKVIHLVDDRRMGGVTRFLDCLSSIRASDQVVHVPRKTMRARKYPAATIVSHLAISWRSLPMLIALRACNPSARLIHVEHSYCAGFEEHRVRKTKRFHTLLRTVYALFDQIVCVSKGQAAWMHKIGVVGEDKTIVATPLVDLDPFLCVGCVQASSVTRYGFVGRLDDQKGLDRAIEAWKLIAPSNATLEIFGDGPKREALEALASDAPSIRFHGRIDEPAKAYESIDIAILPSRWEPYGLSCLEARAAGRAVVVSDVDGLPEQVSEDAGMVVASNLAPWIKVFSKVSEGLLDKRSLKRSQLQAVEANDEAKAIWNGLLEGEASETATVSSVLISSGA